MRQKIILEHKLFGFGSSDSDYAKFSKLPDINWDLVRYDNTCVVQYINRPGGQNSQIFFT